MFQYQVLTLAFVSILSATLAFSNHKVEKVHSEVMLYVNEKMANTTMMRGNSLHLECYNGFIPLLNSLASNAKEVSTYCVTDADELRDQNLLSLKNARKNLEIIVNKIKKSLTDCTGKEGLQYFECLATDAEANRQIMKIIKDVSEGIVFKFKEKFAQIDENEHICLINAIDMAKAASDNAFNNLKACIEGGPTIQPFVDEY